MNATFLIISKATFVTSQRKINLELCIQEFPVVFVSQSDKVNGEWGGHGKPLHVDRIKINTTSA